MAASTVGGTIGAGEDRARRAERRSACGGAEQEEGTGHDTVRAPDERAGREDERGIACVAKFEERESARGALCVRKRCDNSLRGNWQ